MRKSTADAAWLKAAQIVFLILACGAGADYLMQPPKSSLYIVETFIPRAPFGMIFLVLGIMGLIGEWWKELGRSKPPTEASVRWICQSDNRWWPSFTAHAALCAIYVGIFFGCVTEQIVNHHPYGIRVGLAMLALGTGHWAFAQRSRHAT